MWRNPEIFLKNFREIVGIFNSYVSTHFWYPVVCIKDSSCGNCHLDFLETYYKSGKFIVSGRQTPPEGGIIIANNVTKEELESILKEDPFYKNELADFKILEFTPAKYAEEFEKFVK